MVPTSQKTHSEKRPTKVRKLINLSVFFLVSLYIALSPPVVAARLEFFPEKYNPATYSEKSKIKHEDVFVPVSKNRKLHAWLFQAKNAQVTVLMHHGQGQNVAFFRSSAEVLAQCGASVLLYDYEGFGLSDGNPSNEALVRDADACYWYLRKNLGVLPERIVHCGISLGTGAAGEIAASQPCAGVILISPYLKISQVAKDFLPYLKLYPDITFPKPDIGCERLVECKSVPLLVVHGDNDPIIAVSNSDEIVRRWRGPKTYYKIHNGFHIGAIGEGTESIWKDWFQGLIKLHA